MVKKKTKGTKKSKKKGGESHKETVLVHTGLPPQVDGQLRCYLCLSINQILWMIPNPPDLTYVTVHWWGEQGEGAVFRPLDVKRATQQNVCRTLARYPIRAGPKQFAAYLQDMTSLVLEVQTGPMMVTVGRAQVEGLPTLAPNRPINGFFSVLSADSEKVAELQVSLVLESIMASYDSLSSVPTPDMSMNVQHSVSQDAQPVNPPRVIPTPRPIPIYSSTDDPFLSPVAHKFRSATGPHGVDAQIYHHQRAAGIRQSGEMSSDWGLNASGESRMPKTSTSFNSMGEGHKLPGQTDSDAKLDPTSTGTSDLVTELLARGNKLRDAMIVSTLDQQIAGQHEMVKDPMNIDQMMERLPVTPTKETRRGSTGSLLTEILKEREESDLKIPDKMISNPLGFESDHSDLEERAIDLVLGSNLDHQQWKALKALNGNASSLSSLSDDELPSELGDPIHDDSILQALFYKNPDTDESDIEIDLTEVEESKPLRKAHSHSSLEEPGNMRPPSRHSSFSSLIDLDQPMRDTDKQSASPARTPTKKGKKPKKKATKKANHTSQLNSSRISESSKVSFDPTPSDSEDMSVVANRSISKPVDGLSIERLTLLGRVHVARVVIESLRLTDLILDQAPPSPKSKAKGKPPRPRKRACTYFVEYQFPVVATSRDKYAPNAMATEVMRVASKKVADDVVSFGHRSVFSVMFDGEAVNKWWKSALVFKVYSKAPSQKVPKLVGMCSVALKSVLKSEALYLDRHLEVRDRSVGSSGSSRSHSSGSPRSHSSPLVAQLKLSIELGSDSRDFSHMLARTRLAEMTKHNIVPLPQVKRQPSVLDTVESDQNKNLTDTGVLSTAGTQTEPQTADIADLPLAPPVAAPVAPPVVHTASIKTTTEVPQHIPDFSEALTLQTLLMIPEGQHISVQGTPLRQHGSQHPSQPPQPTTGFSGRDLATRNLYLVCRMFWCDDEVRSGVSWGSTDPQFNFVQVAPVLLTASLLERLRNNFMVVEVWDKKTSANNDQLVGIIKLPLHQFYMSYRDRKISSALLKSQFPVVSVDSTMPIMNPISGKQYGHLQVLLAMGSVEQVSVLQRLKKGEGSSIAIAERPSHYLERQHVYSDDKATHRLQHADNIVEHVFETCIEGVSGLKLLENMIWGEADCFVQYHFPTQTETRPQGQHTIVNATPTLKTYRTATTLCTPDPVFHDVFKHRITLVEGSPVQREILTACAGAGGGSGGVPFEIWCRYYYPNIRDQVIAKATLPLAKLCAMVTMQRRGEPSVQTFSLPLTHIAAAQVNDQQEDKPKVQESGLLEVTINYKTTVVNSQRDVRADMQSHNLPGAHVCIAVSILRATGLKSAAVALSRQDAGMQYASEVGVNCYVRTQLSFLQKQDERHTRTVARTFAPEFTCQMDFPCPLLWTEPDSDALSLAEILEGAEATFELWHQVPANTLDLEKHYEYTGGGEVKGRCLVTNSGDILLGTVTIPLISLLTHKTGVSGWHSVHVASAGWDPPPTDRGQHCRGLEQVVGGLEIGIKFAHQEDLDKVVHAGRGVGWAPEVDIESRDWDSADEMSEHSHQVAVSIDKVVFPLSNALLTGQTKLDPKAHCYVRYKVYDKAAVCSGLRPVEENEEGYVEVSMDHKKSLVIPGNSSFTWYLYEERLEVQVWLTHHPDLDKKRPRHRDKLIGSAFINLHSLADRRRRNHRVSDVYALFKPGASSLGGACIQAHVSLQYHMTALSDQSEEDEDRVRVSDRDRSPKRRGSPQASQDVGVPAKQEVDTENTFAVHISIERAYHLPVVTERPSEQSIYPNCYVSYQTGEVTELCYTPVFASNVNPMWHHEHDTRLHNSLLQHNNKNLVFKVWHKTGDATLPPDKSVDRCLGFVSVDLAPLVSGFRQVAGWYNILDFNGQCQGQIQISITPQDELPSILHQAATSGQASTFATTMPTPSFLQGHFTSLEQMDPGTDSIRSRFTKHFNNVKQFHEQLHARTNDNNQLSMTAPPAGQSSFTSLRNRLEELDAMTTQLRQRLVTTTPPGVDGAHDCSSASSAPLTSTTYNLQPFSESGTLELPPGGTLELPPDGTTSTMASIPTTTSHSGAPQSSSLSATTTFIHDSQLSDLPQDSPRGQHSSQTTTPRGQHSSPTTTPRGHSQTVPESQHHRLEEEAQYESMGFAALSNTLSSIGSAGLGNTQNLLSTMDSTYTTRSVDPPVSEREHLVHFEDESLGSNAVSQPQTGVSRDLTQVTQLTLSPPTSLLRPHHHQEYSATLHHSQEEAEEESNALFEQYQQDSEQENEDCDFVMPRPLNDVSNVNFNNTMRNPLAELYEGDQMTKYSEDSWFSNLPSQSEVHAVDTMSNLELEGEEEEIEEDININAPSEGSSRHSTRSLPPDGALGGSDANMSQDLKSVRTERSQKSESQKSGEIYSYSQDSWASEEEEIDAVPEEDLGKQSGSMHSQKESSEEEQHEKELSMEEKKLLNEENPTSFTLVSRTTLGSEGKKSSNSRKMTKYRRQYERHRHGNDDSSDEEEKEKEFNSDSDERSSLSHSYRKSRRKGNRHKKKQQEEECSEARGNEEDLNTSHPLEGHEEDCLFGERDQEEEEGVTLNLGASKDSQINGESDQSKQGSNLREELLEDAEAGPPSSRSGQSDGQTHSSHKPSAKLSNSPWLNFFLPSHDMEASMRALKSAPEDAGITRGKAEAANEMMGKLSSSAKSSRFSSTSKKILPPPDMDKSQRIAQIFSARFSS